MVIESMTGQAYYTPAELKWAVAKACELGIALSKADATRLCQLKILVSGERARLAALAEKASPTSESERLKRRIALDSVAAGALDAGKAYKYCSLDAVGLKKTDIIDFLKADKSEKGYSTLLLGDTGCGKTYGAIAYVARRMQCYNGPKGEEWDGKLVKASDLLDSLGSSKEARAFYKELQCVKYLIVDDLRIEGEGTVTPALKTHIDSLFDKRYSSERVTVFTTNATKEQVIDTYGKRFVSRLIGSGRVFESSQSDLRVMLKTQELV